MAGLPEPADANWPLYAALGPLVRSMMARGIDCRTANRAAFRLFDVLQRPEGETLH